MSGDSESKGESGVLERWTERKAREFDHQLERVKTQDWWTFSKIWLVVSLVLIILSSILSSFVLVEDALRGADTSLLISIVSLIVGLASSSLLFYVFAVSFMAALAFVVSIATGSDEVLRIKNQSYRYVAHSAKIIAGSFILVGIYWFFLKDMYGGVIEFVAVILGVTGIFLLPLGLIFWGVAGFLKEEGYI